MKKALKKLGLALAASFALPVLFLLGLIIFHRINLRLEYSSINPSGYMVTINGHDMHIYLSGDQSGEGPTLVFLPGQIISAPVHHFQPLHQRLSAYYPIAVIEPFGFGYAHQTTASRDLVTVIEEMRSALFSLGKEGPFVLIPHSLGGIDALGWAQRYPDEIAGIVGINMAHPAMFLNGHVGSGPPAWQRAAMWMGLQRLPLFYTHFYTYPYDDGVFSQEDHRQQRLLMNRNAFNPTFNARRAYAFDNAQYIADDSLESALERIGGETSVLLLTTATSNIPYFIPYQDTLAQQLGADRRVFDTGHSIHQYASEEVTDIIRHFLSGL